jgi:hypothetical protein
VASTTQTTLLPSGFSPCVSQGKLRELESEFSFLHYFFVTYMAEPVVALLCISERELQMLEWLKSQLELQPSSKPGRILFFYSKMISMTEEVSLSILSAH